MVVDASTSEDEPSTARFPENQGRPRASPSRHKGTPQRPRHGARPKRSARSEPAAPPRRQKLEENETRALRNIFSHKPVSEARYFDEVANYTRECKEQLAQMDSLLLGTSAYAIADPSKPVGNTSDTVIDDFLYQLENAESAQEHASRMPSRPASAPVPHLAAPRARPVGVRSADRLAEQVEDLKSKLAASFRENRKLKEDLEMKDQKIRKLLDDVERVKKDPNAMHPTISRLRKLGLNTPNLAELGDRWAGYVFGRTSMAMEVGSFSLRNVFATHCVGGVLNEDAFKSVVRQFEPAIKSDQLTRLWFFADLAGSGRIDLFEFMRMLGLNSNGEIGDEYYEVLAMHLYRKFHARGGVRRVYATADKNWDQHLDLQEFSRFIKTFLKDVEFTKQETQQVFHRINTSGSGFMSVQELEAALEVAGARCYVSEAWVKETFQQFAVAVQDAGLSIKQLIPGGAVSEKEFRDLVLRFLPQLRSSQMERLWKFLQQTCMEDPSQMRPAGSDRLSSETVMSAIFGPTLTSSPNETTSLGGPGSAPNYGAGGVGREVLEQLVQQLVRRVGEASPEMCFDALNPFVTAEHFNQLLTSRLGLHYDAVKAKQIFKLIDSDRDGKITRIEFNLMFKTVTPDHALKDTLELPEDGDKENERQQVHRLQNRVLLLQRELELLRGPRGRGAQEPMVPEKQFQQLTTAHAKVATQLQVLKEQRKAQRYGMGHELSDRNSRDGSQLDPSMSSRMLGALRFGSDAKSDTKEAEQFQVQLQELSDANDYLRRRLRLVQEEKGTAPVPIPKDADSSSSSSEDSPKASTPKAGRPTANSVAAAQEKAIAELAKPTLEELWGQVHLILAKLQQALQSNPQLTKKQVQDLLKKFGDVVVEGRWKLQQILSCSTRVVVAVCTDELLNQDVVLKVGQSLEASQQLARVVYILRRLVDVSIAPNVYYFSSPTSSLPFMVMDLLQGYTLRSRFKSIADGEDDAIFELEAAELGYSLLTGMDACHQHQVFNLGLCPEHVWVGPDMDGSRVLILDWNNAEVGAASVSNPQIYAVGDMRRKGLLRGDGKPLFYASSTNSEVQPLDVWTCARKQRAAQTGGSLKSTGPLGTMSNLVLVGHGSLYYMSMEQLYCAIRSYEKDSGTKRPEQTWHQESVGNVVKVEGKIAHWFQKGDGFVQTSLPVAVTPLGQLFEVEVVRAVNAGKRPDSELGFAIGLSAKAPRPKKDETRREKQDCWIAGGDGAFYLKGAQHRVGKRETAEASSEEGYLQVTADLKPKDRVGILAEWSGNLSLFLNGEQVGHFPQAIDPIEVMAPLYGVADMYVRKASEEYTVRSIGLVEGASPGSDSILPELMQRAANELVGIYQHIRGEAAISTTMGPSCDLYACGRLLLSCFRGGADVLPSLNLDRFAVAYADWARAGCRNAEKSYGLLWALKELKSEKIERSEELLDIDKMEIRLLLSRCIKRSRYSRLGSCWEAAEMLAQGACWLGMTDDFLASHKVAVEEAQRAALLDAHYTLAQEIFEQERCGSAAESQAAGESAVRAAMLNAGTYKVKAKWNLRSFTIGPPHIRRIIQVLTQWPKGNQIAAVGFSRFEAEIEPELQGLFIRCFSDVLQPQHGKPMKHRRRRELRHSVGNSEMAAEAKKPLMFLEDVQLPSEELQRSTFSLEEILSRNILWLVVMSVCKVDLTPAPGGMGQEKAHSIGSTPHALDILISAMERSSLLSSLLLRSSHLRDSAGQLLSVAVSRCPSLRELDLSDNHLGSKAVAKLLQAGRDNLQVLDLSRNKLGDDGAKALAEALGKGPSSGYSLAVLRLRSNGIGDEGGEALAEALMSITSLTEFDFSENQVSVQISAVMFRAVCAAKALQRLYLDGNLPWPTSENCEVQVTAFTDQLSGPLAVASLEVLSLRRCKMHSSGATKVFESLSSNQTLRKLNLACNGIRQSAANALAMMLASPSTAIEELDLRDNRLGSQDALAIAMQQVFLPGQTVTMESKLSASDSSEIEAKAAENNCLKTLNLGNNEMTGEALTRLTVAFSGLCALQELYLYHNPYIGDVGAQALADVLSRGATQLQHLNLAACSIADAGCQALMVAIGEYKAMKTLDLSCNAIGDDAAGSVSEVLAQKDCELEKLCLSMNCMSSYGISKLMEGVAENLDGSLREVDVASQESNHAKTSFNEEIGGRSGPKVKSKFVGLR